MSSKVKKAEMRLHKGVTAIGVDEACNKWVGKQ
jgi:hypothetical protein